MASSRVTVPGIWGSASTRSQQLGALTGEPDDIEHRWAAFDRAFNDCYAVAREWAKYHYYWTAWSQWLTDHKSQKNDPVYLERRGKRNGIKPRLDELQAEFTVLAHIVQEHARHRLGEQHYGTIKEKYLLDYSQTGHSVDVFVWQWSAQLKWTPEPPPF